MLNYYLILLKSCATLSTNCHSHQVTFQFRSDFIVLTIFLSKLLLSLYQEINAAGLLPSATHLSVDAEPAISFGGLFTSDTDSGGTVDNQN